MPNSDQPETIEGFLRSATEERVIYTFLDMLAERAARLERAAGLDELRTLREENRRLAERLAVWEHPPLEQLVRFLPVVFRNVWGQVHPQDVALLAGSPVIPEIPSPCPEPSRQEVAARKQELMTLPVEERTRILVACRKLREFHGLEVRPELARFMGIVQ